MELRGKIEAEFVLTPDESAAILQGMLAAGGTASATRTAPRTAPQPKPAAPAPAAPAPATQPATAPTPAAPAPEYRETPEQAITLLKQQFGIDKPKEERTPDEQKKAVALNRAIRGLIRDITRDGSAQSLADLGPELNRQEFVRRCLKLTYDAGANKFNEMPF